jgi:hypothetical protein
MDFISGNNRGKGSHREPPATLATRRHRAGIAKKVINNLSQFEKKCKSYGTIIGKFSYRDQY